MSTTLEVLFSPAEFEAISQRDLSRTWCVVFDVLRATSSMVTALANGARRIVPVADIAEALALKQREPAVRLAGERQGLRIDARLTGSIDFDFGNSPREFARGLRDKTVVMTTTNGTRALRACAQAGKVLAASFLNLGATASYVLKSQPPAVLVICSGTHEEAAYEDTLAAGALCDLLWADYGGNGAADSVLIARKLFLQAGAEIRDALSEARNGKRLLALPELAEDVAFCAQLDRFPLVAEMDRTGNVTKTH